MGYKWPLSKPQFTLCDKLRIAKFILTDSQWTQGKMVQCFEEKMARYIGVNHAIFTSSGSTANTLLAMYCRDKLASPSRNTVVFPSTTWITSVAPFVREGFDVKFIDINLDTFSIDDANLCEYLDTNASKVVCIFATSLIGFSPQIYRLMWASSYYSVPLMMDNCENTLGCICKDDGKNVSSVTTSTTSTYFGHQIQSVEGGFIFTNSEEQYEYFLMARNHGMLRHLPQHTQYKYRNYDVDKKFDFHMLGSNFRNTDIHALIGLLDLQRANQYVKTRRHLYNVFYNQMKDVLILPSNDNEGHAPFCLPIISRRKSSVEDVRNECENNGIETRPIISGNLLRQTCFKHLAGYREFPNSEHLHQYGFYVGLHGSSTLKEVQFLCDLIRPFFV